MPTKLPAQPLPTKKKTMTHAEVTQILGGGDAEPLGIINFAGPVFWPGSVKKKAPVAPDVTNVGSFHGLFVCLLVLHGTLQGGPPTRYNLGYNSYD